MVFKFCENCGKKFYKKDCLQKWYSTTKEISNTIWERKKYCCKRCARKATRNKRIEKYGLEYVQQKEKQVRDDFNLRNPDYGKERYHKLKNDPIFLEKKRKAAREYVRKSGKGYTYYNNKRREKIYKKYNNECALCGYNQYKKILIIHHMDEGMKKNEKKFIRDKHRLIVLCPNCHTKYHLGLIKKKDLLKKYKEFNNE